MRQDMIPTITHSVRFSYTEDTIPPRCRKARPTRFHDGIFLGFVPNLANEDAPVAIRSCGTTGYGDNAAPFTIDYRWYNNQLWTAIQVSNCEPQSYVCGTSPVYNHPPLATQIDARTEQAYPDHFTLQVHYYAARTKAEIKRDLAGQFANNILIDGQRYRPAGEPRYVVQTFGLGGNHGGTAVFATDHYNSNIPNHRYFRLDQRNAALALGEAIARKRGDTQSLPMHVNGNPTFEVLIPKALQVDPYAQHTTGDPFLNRIDAITQECSGSDTSSLLAAVMLIGESQLLQTIGHSAFAAAKADGEI